MSDDWEARVRALSPAKALAIAAYWESVAAYRYRVLSERVTSAEHRRLFAKMAVEEQAHHLRMHESLKEHFPDSDFVLTPEDKDLVIVGPRLLELPGADALQRALDLIYESECRTARFYSILEHTATRPDLRPLLKEMAAECREHAERLKAIPPFN